MLATLMDEPMDRAAESAEEGAAERQRLALRRFMETHRLKPHPWAVKAGVSSGSLYAFLKGESEYLSLPVAQKLAAVVGASVAALLGDEAGPPPLTAPVTHHLRGDELVPLARSPRRRAPMPRDANSGTLRVAEVQQSTQRLLPAGSMIYWHETAAPMENAARRICALEVVGRGLLLGDPRPGFGEGRSLIVCCSGELIDDAEITAAYPIDWIKPA